MYEDLGLLTSDRVVTEDVALLFNHLSGFARTVGYRRILVAPQGVRRGLLERIEREVQHHLSGRPARVRIKVNSLVDEALCDALYRASQAGVPVDLWIRGICTLRPGVPGLSDNIRVRSILGRFLEHSRVFWFVNGGEPEVWIGSADLMHRNLDRRVEVLVQLKEPDHYAELAELFDLGFDDRTGSWWLQPDDTWQARLTGEDGQPLRDLQERLVATRGRRRLADPIAT
jgi:polyphosphate kinase